MKRRQSRGHAHLTNVLGAFVTSCQDRMEAAFQSELAAGGGAPAAVLALRTWPGSSIDELRGYVGLSHSGAVRLVERLQDSGLVEKRAGSDRRTASLHLTRRGSATARRIHTRRTALLSALIEGLSHDEQEVLDTLLDKMLRGTERTRGDARHECRLCDHTVCEGDACPIGASVPG